MNVGLDPASGKDVSGARRDDGSMPIDPDDRLRMPLLAQTTRVLEVWACCALLENGLLTFARSRRSVMPSGTAHPSGPTKRRRLEERVARGLEFHAP